MQEIEIEFKNILTKQEFDTLLQWFQIKSEQFQPQTNYYFDTEDYLLKKNESALRIRKKGHDFILTLKQPLEEGLLETHQVLSENEALALLNGGPIPYGLVYDQVEAVVSTPASIVYFGELMTERTEVAYKDGIIVLDKSHYLNHTDYEVEYEVRDAVTGKKTFEELLHSLSIPIRETNNKIKRFYLAKYNQKD
ncbi:hypothetical protein Q75_04695 [Bacillus coahuilensis p1.1.43]|uniref:CYTH domain-containing protein n=1 Tax=Bacillus coahuilensis p1.1.43 TaxID=1150625 RepID=A0A147KA02_9BACI|nr:CYTH domain-containing protein [Bacillus coahuilensis]KUP07535.1 hypothetical protein Q75_04695 [Bacillus coahuilensis p1.1.43]